MYYTLSTQGDEDGNIIGFTFDDDDVEDKDWELGKKFTNDEAAQAWQKAPTEVIRLNIRKGREKAPLPDFMSQPSPLMSKKLLETVRAAGVKNIDAYPAALYYADGTIASTDHFIINVIGVVKKTDEIDPDNDFLLFRYEENIVSIYINETIKQAIEKANITYVRMYSASESAPGAFIKN